MSGWPFSLHFPVALSLPKANTLAKIYLIFLSLEASYQTCGEDFQGGGGLVSHKENPPQPVFILVRVPCVAQAGLKLSGMLGLQARATKPFDY